MSTGPHTFQRFVTSAGYCMLGEYAYSASAPTKDSPSCPLGYRCDSARPLWFDDDDHGFFGR